jgi:hypothetical protein
MAGYNAAIQLRLTARVLNANRHPYFLHAVCSVEYIIYWSEYLGDSHLQQPWAPGTGKLTFDLIAGLHHNN